MQYKAEEEEILFCQTNNKDNNIRNCQPYYGFKLPSELWSNMLKGLMSNMPPAARGSFVNYGTNAT